MVCVLDQEPRDELSTDPDDLSATTLSANEHLLVGRFEEEAGENVAPVTTGLGLFFIFQCWAKVVKEVATFTVSLILCLALDVYEEQSYSTVGLYFTQMCIEVSLENRTPFKFATLE